MKLKTNLKIIKGRPDMIPFLGVLFLLLIFFTLSSSFVKISGIEINLPETASINDSTVEKLVITVDRKNNIFFNDMPLPSIENPLPENTDNNPVPTGETAAKKSEIRKSAEAVEDAAIDELSRKLKDFESPLYDAVIIRADKKTSYGVIVKLMSLARIHNFNVYVATGSENTEEKDFDAGVE